MFQVDLFRPTLKKMKKKSHITVGWHNSPEFNIIEPVWFILEQKFRNRIRRYNACYAISSKYPPHMHIVTSVKQHNLPEKFDVNYRICLISCLQSLNVLIKFVK